MRKYIGVAYLFLLIGVGIYLALFGPPGVSDIADFYVLSPIVGWATLTVGASVNNWFIWWFTSNNMLKRVFAWAFFAVMLILFIWLVSLLFLPIFGELQKSFG